MRITLTLLFLFPLFAFPQSLNLFGDDPDFEVTKVPDSLKDQSFVMLCIRDQYEFSALRTNEKRIVYYGADSHKAVEKLRMRAALMDEAAVERFGFVNFDEGELKSVEIIKPNGTIEKVDIDQAVEVVREDVESKGIQNSKRRRSARTAREMKFKKLALTSLTAGDIVDLTFEYEETFSGAFEINFEVLRRPYPVLKHKLHFVFDEDLRNPDKDYKQMRFRFSSHNGAPEIREESKYHFVFEAENLADYERERWSLPPADLPFIKYGFYTDIALKILDQDDQTSGFLLPNLSKSELRAINKKFDGFDSKIIDKGFDNLLKKSKPKLKNLMKEDPVDNFPALYRYLRQYHISARHLEITDRRINALRYYMFEKYDVPASIVIVLPRYVDSLGGLTFFQECEKGYRIPAEEDIYLFDFSTFRQPGEIPYQFEGCLALEAKFYQKEKISTIDARHERLLLYKGVHRLPVSSAADNRQHHEMTVSLDLGKQEAEINTTITTSGHLREYSWPYFMQFERYEEDIAYFEKLDVDVSWNNLGATQEEMDQMDEDKKARLKNHVEDSWGEIEIIEMEEIQAGRTPEKPASILRQHVKTNDMLKKVGPNYIFDAGMLIHAQSQFKDEQRERKTNIYMDYARTYDETISIMVPEGYTVDGLENFSFSVDNETGSFESSAVLAGDRIILNAKKVYKHNYEPKENWPLMLEFIDAAYNFSQAKLLFRKQ